MNVRSAESSTASTSTAPTTINAMSITTSMGVILLYSRHPTFNPGTRPAAVSGTLAAARSHLQPRPAPRRG
jgi:hypothetical protein